MYKCPLAIHLTINQRNKEEETKVLNEKIKELFQLEFKISWLPFSAMLDGMGWCVMSASPLGCSFWSERGDLAGTAPVGGI